jgi:hypothetical protein
VKKQTVTALMKADLLATKNANAFATLS